MVLYASTYTQETIQVLWNMGAIGGLTDAQLLERFLSGPDEGSEVAFTVLVERYGPNVRRVCLDMLSDPHEAQDAAQAVFLVLAGKARSIRKPESLGPWLHGVAVRMARRIRAEAARRREIEQRRAEAIAERLHTQHNAEPDRYIELYEEIERLPEKYRDPIVLCYLQGHTQEQASQRLGWPLGTVQTRLHRGRERLRTRLSRRGIGPSGIAATAVALPRNTATAAAVPVPPSWVNATARAAVQFAAGTSTAGLVPPIVVRLAEGALVTMLREALKAFALGILVVGLASLGVALGVRAVTNGREPHRRSAAPTAAPAQPVLARAQPVRTTPPPRKRPNVDLTIKAGTRYLEARQQRDGSWPDVDIEAHTGLTSLVTLALLGADEPAALPSITRAIEYLRGFTPDQLHSVYAVSLQTRAFAAMDFEQDVPRIARNVEWLERAQIKPGDRVEWPGSWMTGSSGGQRN
jgi:RNA polymerase sigma factor (sigma-70 family)